MSRSLPHLIGELLLSAGKRRRDGDVTDDSQSAAAETTAASPAVTSVPKAQTDVSHPVLCDCVTDCGDGEGGALRTEFAEVSTTSGAAEKFTHCATRPQTSCGSSTTTSTTTTTSNNDHSTRPRTSCGSATTTTTSNNDHSTRLATSAENAIEDSGTSKPVELQTEAAAGFFRVAGVGEAPVGSGDALTPKTLFLAEFVGRRGEEGESKCVQETAPSGSRTVAQGGSGRGAAAPDRNEWEESSSPRGPERQLTPDSSESLADRIDTARRRCRSMRSDLTCLSSRCDSLFTELQLVRDRQASCPCRRHSLPAAAVTSLSPLNDAAKAPPRQSLPTGLGDISAYVPLEDFVSGSDSFPVSSRAVRWPGKSGTSGLRTSLGVVERVEAELSHRLDKLTELASSSDDPEALGNVTPIFTPPPLHLCEDWKPSEAEHLHARAEALELRARSPTEEALAGTGNPSPVATPLHDAVCFQSSLDFHTPYIQALTCLESFSDSGRLKPSTLTADLRSLQSSMMVQTPPSSDCSSSGWDCGRGGNRADSSGDVTPPSSAGSAASETCAAGEHQGDLSLEDSSPSADRSPGSDWKRCCSGSECWSPALSPSVRQSAGALEKRESDRRSRGFARRKVAAGSDGSQDDSGVTYGAVSVADVATAVRCVEGVAGRGGSARDAVRGDHSTSYSWDEQKTSDHSTSYSWDEQKTSDHSTSYSWDEQKTSDHNTSDHNTSDQKTSDHNTSDHNTSDQKTSDNNTSDQETSDHNTSDHNTSDHNTSDHSTSDHNTSDHNTSDHNMSDHNTSDQKTSDHNTSAHNMNDHNTSDQKTSDHNTSDHNTSDQKTRAAGTREQRTRGLRSRPWESMSALDLTDLHSNHSSDSTRENAQDPSSNNITNTNDNTSKYNNNNTITNNNDDTNNNSNNNTEDRNADTVNPRDLPGAVPNFRTQAGPMKLIISPPPASTRLPRKRNSGLQSVQGRAREALTTPGSQHGGNSTDLKAASCRRGWKPTGEAPKTVWQSRRLTPGLAASRCSSETCCCSKPCTDRKQDREDRGEDREDRGKDCEDKIEDREDRGKDREDKIEDREDRGQDREDRGKDREDRGEDREDRGKDCEDKIEDREDRGQNREDRGKDREDRGKDREDKIEDREDRGQNREDRGQDREHRGQDREDRVEDRGDRGQDREDRGQDREDRGKDREDRGQDREDRVEDREDRGQDVLKTCASLFNPAEHGTVPSSRPGTSRSDGSYVGPDVQQSFASCDEGDQPEASAVPTQRESHQPVISAALEQRDLRHPITAADLEQRDLRHPITAADLEQRDLRHPITAAELEQRNLRQPITAAAPTSRDWHQPMAPPAPAPSDTPRKTAHRQNRTRRRRRPELPVRQLLARSGRKAVRVSETARRVQRGPARGAGGGSSALQSYDTLEDASCGLNFLRNAPSPHEGLPPVEGNDDDCDHNNNDNDTPPRAVAVVMYPSCRQAPPGVARTPPQPPSAIPTDRSVPAGRPSHAPDRSCPAAQSHVPDRSCPAAHSHAPDRSCPAAQSHVPDRSCPAAQSHVPDRSCPAAPSHAPDRSCPAAPSHVPERSCPAAQSHVPDRSCPAAQSHVPDRSCPAAPSHVPERSCPAAASHVPDRHFPITQHHVPDRNCSAAQSHVPDGSCPAAQSHVPDGSCPAAQSAGSDRSGRAGNPQWRQSTRPALCAPDRVDGHGESLSGRRIVTFDELKARILKASRAKPTASRLPVDRSESPSAENGSALSEGRGNGVEVSEARKTEPAWNCIAVDQSESASTSAESFQALLETRDKVEEIREARKTGPTGNCTTTNQSESASAGNGRAVSETLRDPAEKRNGELTCALSRGSSLRIVLSNERSADWNTDVTPASTDTALSGNKDDTPARTDVAFSGYKDDTPARTDTALSGNKDDTPARTDVALSGYKDDTPARTDVALLGNKDDTPARTDTVLSGNKDDTLARTDVALSGYKDDTPASTDTVLSGNKDDTLSSTDTVLSGNKDDTPAKTDVALSGNKDDTPARTDVALSGNKDDTPARTDVALSGNKDDTPARTDVALAEATYHVPKTPRRRVLSCILEDEAKELAEEGSQCPFSSTRASSAMTASEDEDLVAEGPTPSPAARSSAPGNAGSDRSGQEGSASLSCEGSFDVKRTPTPIGRKGTSGMFTSTPVVSCGKALRSPGSLVLYPFFGPDPPGDQSSIVQARTDTHTPSLCRKYTHTPSVCRADTHTPSLCRNDAHTPSLCTTDTHIPSPCRADSHTLSLCRNDTHTPSLCRNDTHTPSLCRKYTHTPSLCRNDTHTPSLYRNDTHTPSLCRNDTHTPSVCRNDTHTPSLCRNDTHTPSLCRNDTHTPSLCRNDTHTPSLCRNDTHTPSVCSEVGPVSTTVFELRDSDYDASSDSGKSSMARTDEEEEDTSRRETGMAAGVVWVEMSSSSATTRPTAYSTSGGFPRADLQSNLRTAFEECLGQPASAGESSAPRREGPGPVQSGGVEVSKVPHRALSRKTFVFSSRTADLEQLDLSHLLNESNFSGKVGEAGACCDCSSLQLRAGLLGTAVSGFGGCAQVGETCAQVGETCAQVDETCAQVGETCAQVGGTCAQVGETCAQVDVPDQSKLGRLRTAINDKARPETQPANRHEMRRHCPEPSWTEESHPSSAVVRQGGPGGPERGQGGLEGGQGGPEIAPVPQSRSQPLLPTPACRRPPAPFGSALMGVPSFPPCPRPRPSPLDPHYIPCRSRGHQLCCRCLAASHVRCRENPVANELGRDWRRRHPELCRCRGKPYNGPVSLCLCCDPCHYCGPHVVSKPEPARAETGRARVAPSVSELSAHLRQQRVCEGERRDRRLPGDAPFAPRRSLGLSVTEEPRLRVHVSSAAGVCTAGRSVGLSVTGEPRLRVHVSSAAGASTAGRSSGPAVTAEPRLPELTPPTSRQAAPRPLPLPSSSSPPGLSPTPRPVATSPPAAELNVKLLMLVMMTVLLLVWSAVVAVVEKPLGEAGASLEPLCDCLAVAVL